MLEVNRECYRLGLSFLGNLGCGVFKQEILPGKFYIFCVNI